MLSDQVSLAVGFSEEEDLIARKLECLRIDIDKKIINYNQKKISSKNIKHNIEILNSCILAAVVFLL